MARKSFEEVIKDREKAKKSGTYTGTASSNEQTAGRDSIETVLERRKKAIKNGTYKRNTDFPEQRKTNGALRDNMSTYANYQPPKESYQEAKKKLEETTPTKQISYEDAKVQAEKELQQIKDTTKRNNPTVNWDKMDEIAVKARTKQIKNGYTNDEYNEYLNQIQKNAEPGSQQQEWVDKQRKNLTILQDEDTRKAVEKYVKGSKNFLEYMDKHDGEYALNKLGYTEEEIVSLADTYNREKNAQRTQDYKKWADDMTGDVDGNFVASNLALGARTVSMFGILDQAAKWLDGKLTGEYVPIDENTYFNASAKFANRVQQNVTEDIHNADEEGNISPTRKGLGMAYNAGMSVLGNAVPMAVQYFTKIPATLPLGMQAATDTGIDTFERTGDTGKSVLSGGVVGGIEAATEKWSLDHFWDIAKSQGKAATRNWFINLLAQSGIEGSEEGIAEVATLFADRLINGGKAEYDINVKNYQMQGLTEKESKKLATRDFLGQLKESVIIGAMAGGMSGTVGTAIQGVNNIAKGSGLRTDGQVDSILEKASGYEDARVKKALEKYQKNPTDYAIGKLMTEMQIVDDIKNNQLKNGSKSKIEDSKSNETSGMQGKVTAINVKESMNHMKQAKSPSELVSILRNVEEHGTENDIQQAQNYYEYQKAKMITNGLSDDVGFQRAEMQLTDTEAYRLGQQNKKVDNEQLSTTGRIAYNNGLQEYLLKESQSKTISDKRIVEQAEARDNQGNDIIISKLQSVEGEPVVVTKNGTTPLKDVTFSNAAVQTLYNNASTKGTTEAANIYLTSYPAGMPVNNYDIVFERMVKAGELGVSIDGALKRNSVAYQTVGEEGLRAIYELGKMRRVAPAQQGRTVKKKGTGKVVDQRTNKTEEPLLQLYEKIAEKTGIDVLLQDADMEGINGYFSQAMSEIVLNTEENGYSTVLHELGEFTDLWNAEEMADFQTAFLEWYFEKHGDKVNDLIEKYQGVYQEQEGSKSFREAADEMMRDGLAGLFGTDEGVNDFTNWLTENRTQTETKSIIQTITEFLQKLCDKIKAYIQGHELNTVARQALEMEADRATELRKQFLQVADKAIENYQRAEVDDSDNSKNMVYSLHVDERIRMKAEQFKRDGYKNFERVKVLDVTPRINAEVRRLIGFDATGYEIYSNTNTYKHIENRHGENGKKDQSMKDMRDVALMGYVLEEFDNAELVLNSKGEVDTTSAFVDKNGKPSKMIKFSKKIEGVQHVVIAAPENNYKKLWVLSEYIEQKKDTSQTSYGDKALPPTPEANPDNVSSNTSISETRENTTKNVRNSLKVDTEGRELTEAQQEFFKDAKTVDEKGRLKPFYHGTGRADRVGYTFRADRATSGPMAYFTDSQQIADNYARDKQDTSIEYDEMYDDYYSQFRVEINGKNMSVSELWNKMTYNQRMEIKKKAPHITMNEDYDSVVYDETAQYGPGGYDPYTLNMHKGNVLEALTDVWLESGTIYGEEQMFLDVLHLVGVDDVWYMNPDYRDEKTYQVYLNITNPFDTSNISDKMLNEFKMAAEYAEYTEGNSTDMWDKRNIQPEEWIERLERDIAEGTTHTWTSIPDFVTDVLKQNGYDGIFDTGGKNGGSKHVVAIPFYSNQIKEVTNQEPTKGNDDIRYSLNIDDYLSDTEQGIFWNKIGERKNGTQFPKSRNGDSILTIGNKLVYTGRGYINPKVNQIVEIIVDEDSEYESTYTSFIQEDIIEYERNKKNKRELETFTNFIKENYRTLFGKRVDILLHEGRTSQTIQKNGTNGKSTTRRKAYYNFENEQDGRGDTGESTGSTSLRYSLTDTSDLDYLWESDSFYDITASSASILEEGAKALQGKEVDRQLVHKIAWHIKQDYRSKINLETLTDNLVKVFSYMQTQEKANYEDMVRVMNEVAQPVLEESNDYDPTEVQQYQDFKRKLKSTRIKLSDQQKQEVAYYYDSYENFRRKMFGTLTLAEDGAYLDSVWSEIVDYSNGYLEYDANYVEQPIALVNALDMMKPQLRNNFGADNHGVAMDLSLQIYEEYFKAQADSKVKALQRKMVHERALWHDKVRKEYYQKLAEERQRMKDKTGTIQSRVAEVRAAYTASELEKKQKQKASQYRNNIKRTGAQLIKWIESPTDKQHVPEPLKKVTLEFLGAIDFISHRALDSSQNTKRWQEMMKSVETKLSAAMRNEAFDEYGSFIMDLDPDFLPMLHEFTEKNDTTEKISLMDYSQLENLNTLINTLKRTITKANELHANKMYKHVADAAGNTIQELQKKKDKKQRIKGVDKVDKLLNLDMLDSLSFFELMGQGGKSIYRSIREGFNARTWHVLEAQQYLKEVLKDVDAKELKSWTGNDATVHEFKVKDGNLKLTTGQIMSLYLLGRRNQAVQHIMQGGIVASEIGKGKKKLVQAKARHITRSQFKEIVNILTPEQKRVADQMQRFLAVNCAEWGNRASMQMYGYKKFQDDRYFPIKSHSGQIATTDKTAASEALLYAIKNQGMTKNIVKGAKNAIMAEDIMDAFVNHVVGMANYDAFAAPLADAMKWFNYKNDGMDGEFYEADTVKEEIARVYSKKANDYFVQLLKDINGETTNSTSTEITDVLVSNYKASAVMANARVIVQQPTAYMRASLVLSPADMLKGLAHKPSVKKAKENSAIANWKSLGYYETNMGQSMKQIITGQQSLSESIRDKGGLGAQLADEITWGYLWNACESEIKRKNPKLDTDSKEFLEKVTERFDDVIDQTQVVDTITHRTQFMRSKDRVIKMEAAFMSEPHKSYNMLYRASKQGKKAFGKAVLVYSMTGVLTSMAAALVDVWRDDDEDETVLEKYLSALKSNMWDNMNPLGMIPYVKDAISLIQGYDVERMDMSAVSKLVTATQSVLKGNKTTYGTVKAYTRVASMVLGIPAYNLLREVESMIETISGEAIDENKAKAGDLYEDLLRYKEEGKDDKYDKAYDKLLDMDKDEKEIRSGIRTKVNSMFKSGKITEEEAISILWEWGYDEPREIVEKWKENMTD